MHLENLIHKVKRFVVTKLLDLIVYMNGSHVSCDSEEDTAELSEDRKRMIINFVFCGQKHKIELGYDYHELETSEYDVYDKSGILVAEGLKIGIPGLEGVVFGRDNLKLCYGGEIGDIVSRYVD